MGAPWRNLAMGRCFMLFSLSLATCCWTSGGPGRGAEAPAAKKGDYVTQRSRELKPTRTLVYKTIGRRQLQLHVFEPPGHRPADRRPCFLVIHGGGWVAG